MEEKQVKVAIRLVRLEECYMMLLEHAGKALIGNVAHAVDGKMRGSFLEQQRTDLNGINTTEN